MSISINNTNSAKSEFELDTWTHLVGTFNGRTIKTYINGEFVESKEHPGELYDAGKQLQLTGSFEGDIDELYIYDAVLNKSQVKLLYEM